MLKVLRVGRARWSEIFSVKELLFKAAKAGIETSTLLAHVAGGRAYEIQAFENRSLNKIGRLVLRDLCFITNDIKELHPGIVRMKYEIFHEQPSIDKRSTMTESCLTPVTLSSRAFLKPTC